MISAPTRPGVEATLQLLRVGTGAPRLVFTPHGSRGPGVPLASPAHPALALARQENRAFRLLGRAFVHDLNGKIMGIGCIVSSAGLVETGRLQSADAALVEQAISELRDAAALQTLLLRPFGPVPLQLDARALSRHLHRLLISCFRRHRPVDATASGCPCALPPWAIRTCLQVAADAAHTFDALETTGSPFPIRIEAAADVSTVELTLQLPRWREHARHGNASPLVQQFLLATSVLAHGVLELPDDFLHITFREPGHAYTNIQVGSAAPPADSLAVDADPESLTDAVLRHASTAASITLGPGTDTATTSRATDLAAALGLHLHHA
jgi:hypothetical protein